MSLDNQIEPPQSFMAMYLTPGRDRPNAPQSVILARYELCEDMASLLAEQVQTLAFEENFAGTGALMKCYQGLLAGEADFTPREAAWVVLRLAERLGWEAPEWLIAALAGPAGHP